MTHDNLEDALLSDPTLGFVALHLGQDMATRRRLLCEGLTFCLRDLEVDGIIQAPVGEYGPDVKYTLSLAPLWALMKQRYAEAEIETALDCALLQIVRVLMVGDALSAKEIQRRAMLLKRETWTRMLMLTKMEYVEQDIPIENVNSIGCDDYYDTGGDGHDDERVWRIRLEQDVRDDGHVCLWQNRASQCENRRD
ncbi:hypothetical protein BC940DRAFT_30347 [Gongronella butleri]|nr:hypothetical protein BC940DRAFT_30347 [Gongronella butleri]